MINKKNNFLSFFLNFIWNLEIIIDNINKKGNKTPICFPKNMKGCDIWLKKVASLSPVLWKA